jgi:O-methyltransferase involved in polyketide biosynthesis
LDGSYVHGDQLGEILMRPGKPSRTAEYMTLFRALETAETPDRRLFEDPYAIPPLVGRLVPAFLHLGWPYTRSSGVVRTRMIADLVRDTIRSRFMPRFPRPGPVHKNRS